MFFVDIFRLCIFTFGLVRVFDNLNELMQRLRRDMILMHRSDLVIDTCSSEGLDINHSFTHVDSYTGRFVWNLLFIYQLVRNKHKLDLSQLKRTMVEQLRIEHSQNASLLTQVEIFEHEDAAQNPIEWYTKDTLIYVPMNKAFRTRNPELICKFQYFLIVLHDQMETLWHEQRERRRSAFVVYRSQLMGKAQFALLEARRVNLVSINAFFSTSTNPEVADVFSGVLDADPEKVPVRLEITIERSRDSTRYPYAFIEELSQFAQEDELLFFPGALLRLDSVEKATRGREAIIRLTLCHESVGRLDAFFDTVERVFAAGYSEDFERMMNSESDFHLFNKFHYVLVGSHNHVEELLIGRLGLVLQDLAQRFGQYQATIDYYEQLLNDEQFMPSHPKQRDVILNILIGRNYFFLKDYDQALTYYQIALVLLHDENHQAAGEIRQLRGDVEMVRNNLHVARDEYERTDRIFDRCQLKKKRFRARVCWKLVDVNQRLGASQEVKKWQREAERWAPPVIKRSESNLLSKIDGFLQVRSNADVGNQFYAAALSALNFMDFPFALRQLKKEEKVLLENLRSTDDYVHRFATLNELFAYVYYRLNDYCNALIFWKRAIDIRAGFTVR